MKVTVIFGSPRKNGNTAALLGPFMEELEKGGAEIEYFDVYEKQIAGCRVCLGCQKDTEHICCVLQDDMQPILRALEKSDLFVMAAPIYAWNIPAPAKVVLDRMVYASCKYYGGDPHGPSLLKGKRMALITTCGYPVEKGCDLYVEAMKRSCKHLQMEYAGCLCERQRSYRETFMTPDKEAAARAFARELLAEKP